MKIISVNVGGVRTVEWDGNTVRTGIYKEPVPGRVRVGRLNLEEATGRRTFTSRAGRTRPSTSTRRSTTRFGKANSV